MKFFEIDEEKFLWEQEYKLFIRQLISWFYNRNFSFGLTTRGSKVWIISRTSTARNCQRWFSIWNLCGYSFRGCSSCRCSKSRRRSVIICSQFFQIQCFSRISFENSRINWSIQSVLYATVPNDATPILPSLMVTSAIVCLLIIS